MKLRSSIVWIVVFLLFVSMASMAAQRGGGGRGGGGNQRGGGNPRGGTNNPQNGNEGGNNPRGRGGLPPEGSSRDDTLRVTNKPRVMLEIVDMLQRRTGRPISYEDPLWVYEGTKQRDPNGKVLSEIPGDIKRTEGFKDVSKPNAPVKDLISLTPGTFEFKLVVDARSHLLPEPIDGSIGAILTTIVAEYKNKQLPGSFTHGYLGDVNAGGYGWIVLPDKFRDNAGKWVEPRRVLDYPISFATEERPTLATFQLITELVSKASGQQVQFKKLVSDTNVTGSSSSSLKPVDLKANQFVRIGANNETARSVIAKALRTIERGDPRTQGPIPQRSWRLLYSIEAKAYFLDVVEVRQESYKIDGTVTGTKPVNWPTSPAPTAAAAPASGSGSADRP